MRNAQKRIIRRVPAFSRGFGSSSMVSGGRGSSAGSAPAAAGRDLRRERAVLTAGRFSQTAGAHASRETRGARPFRAKNTFLQPIHSDLSPSALDQVSLTEVTF